MRPAQKQNRARGRGNRKSGNGGNNVNRVYDSAGPEGKVRGTPQQIVEKYLSLARDAQTSGDRVTAENFLQHAEHYQRILSAALGAQSERREGQGQDDDDDDRQPQHYQHGGANGQSHGGDQGDGQREDDGGGDGGDQSQGEGRRRGRRGKRTGGEAGGEGEQSRAANGSDGGGGGREGTADPRDGDDPRDSGQGIGGFDTIEPEDTSGPELVVDEPAPPKRRRSRKRDDAPAEGDTQHAESGRASENAASAGDEV